MDKAETYIERNRRELNVSPKNTEQQVAGW